MPLIPFDEFRMRLSRFLAEAPNSLKDHLNLDELVRVVTAALGAGGGIFGLLLAIASRVGEIFPSPADAGLAAAVLAALIEAYRRLGHGTTPKTLTPRPRR